MLFNRDEIDRVVDIPEHGIRIVAIITWNSPLSVNDEAIMQYEFPCFFPGEFNALGVALKMP